MSQTTAINIQDEPTPKTVGKNQMGSLTHLIPKGSLLSEQQQQPLVDALEQCLSEWDTQVIIDFAGIALLNSRNIETLLLYQKKLTRVGGWLKLTNIKPLIRDILAITAADEQILVIENALSNEIKKPVATVDSNAPVRIGDLLIEKELLSKDKVEEAILLQKKLGKRLGQIVIDKGWVSEHDFLSTLSEQLDLPYISLRTGLYDPDIFSILNSEITLRLKIVPLFLVNNSLSIATADPQAIASFSEIEDRLNCRVRPVLARKEDILKTLNEADSSNDFGAEIIEAIDEDFEIVDSVIPSDYSGIDDMAAGSPVINMVNSIIQRAVHDKASDIHIEPSQKKCRVRFRIDGLLYEVMSPRIELHPALISRLKVMANLDIAERRLPQDGRIQVHTQGRSVDLRFSSLPGLYGEKVVLRVLDKNSAIMDISSLGMQQHNIDAFKRLLNRSYGLILVTGPTGSGKTTSLYSALNHINSIEKNIVTIEDPVEYQLDIVNQNPVKEKIGLTFAKMLKHILRQDPDIVMVGEIRERETAEIAVQAALTGHLVLSTLHTNDSVGAVTRMLDMGIEPYLLSSALIGVVAQRLVRSICPHCKTEYLASPDLKERFNWQDKGKIKLSKGRGCKECYDSGYRGRLGIHEIIETDSDMQKLIISNPSRDNLTDYLNSHKIKLLFDDGLDRVLEGKTTIEEISRVINS
ncbi:MAG: Flp pilus assembly complex ATPase component TadA [Thiotrichaceae bacterium]|nr:Flp pilus assembly complex ATPase component TadA [Thiotrichaceae bacterium]